MFPFFTTHPRPLEKNYMPKVKFSANNFVLSEAEDHPFGPLNKPGVADLHLLRKVSGK